MRLHVINFITFASSKQRNPFASDEHRKCKYNGNNSDSKKNQALGHQAHTFVHAGRKFVLGEVWRTVLSPRLASCHIEAQQRQEMRQQVRILPGTRPRRNNCKKNKVKLKHAPQATAGYFNDTLFTLHPLRACLPKPQPTMQPINLPRIRKYLLV